MKQISFVLIFILIISCAKQPIEPIDIERNWIISGLNRPYEFRISAEKGLVSLYYEGKKDALGRIEMNGYMKIDDEKTIYNVYFDGAWYDRITGEEIRYDYPINPGEFVSNCIISDKLTNAEISGNGFKFTADINTVFISPLNYRHEGTVITSSEGLLKSVKVKDDELTLTINITYNNSIYITPSRKVVSEMKNAYTINEDILRKRLEMTGNGTIKKGIIELYNDFDKRIEMLLTEESVYAGVYKYTEPMEENDEKYINGNKKNTAVIIDTIRVFKNVNIIPVSRGPYVDMIIEDEELPDNDKLCIFTNDYIFNLDKIDDRFVITEMPEYLSAYIFALIEFQ